MASVLRIDEDTKMNIFIDRLLTMFTLLGSSLRSTSGSLTVSGSLCLGARIGFLCIRFGFRSTSGSLLINELVFQRSYQYFQPHVAWQQPQKLEQQLLVPSQQPQKRVQQPKGVKI